MNSRPILILIAATLAPPLAASADDKPPVEVHVVEDGDELYPRRGDGERGRDREEAALDADAEEARARIDAKRRRGSASGGEGAVSQEAQTAVDEDCERGPWFWHKPTGVRQGDLLLSWNGGFGAGGGFGGGAAEYMFGERFGLRVMGLFDALGNKSDFHGKMSGWDFTGGAWGLGASAFRGSPSGFVGLVEPNLTYHFRPGERLDVFASAGVSAFMYRVDEARGGSALLRTSIGAQWFWKALFVGAEVGWYPVEIARVVGRREAGVDIYNVDRPPEAFDARRATLVAHVGLRL